MTTAPTLPGWRHTYSGKVRDVYVPDPAGRAPAGSGGPAQDVVLVVASDRVSAYDHVLPSLVPDKGAILTALTLWWFGRLRAGGLDVPHHVLSTAVPGAVAGRAMVCRRLQMLPVECVARGYLTGSALADYRRTGAVCGVVLRPGLHDGDRLDAPVFTPATKAPTGEHDENVSYECVVETVGEDVAAHLRRLTMQAYAIAERTAGERGILLADTKLEFGTDPATGELVLGDEVLTPDSSRFWPAEHWQPGGPQPSFDKQVVRDWLTSAASGWDRRTDAPPPPLPQEVVQRTRDRYLEAYRRLTGTSWRTDAGAVSGGAAETDTTEGSA